MKTANRQYKLAGIPVGTALSCQTGTVGSN